MLKGISPDLTPDLLWALAAMGHGDVLAVVDANYPAYALHPRVLPLAGVDTVTAAEAITHLMPVDDFVEPAAWAMVPDGDTSAIMQTHAPFASVLTQNEGRQVKVSPLERTEFYQQAKSAFAVVLTGDTSPYACFLVTKGVVSDLGRSSAK